jgi:hypothetical protein
VPALECLAAFRRIDAGKRSDAQGFSVYVKPSRELVHGYRGQDRNTPPLNRFGVGPVLIPAVGANLGPLRFQ